ncbi:ABC transporter substrate-binding protein [Oculatella sp. LEGE 06141]|nr:ABC transporter substrate-binding protein [Oculatella sp. LEGE 06141]
MIAKISASEWFVRIQSRLIPQSWQLQCGWSRSVVRRSGLFMAALLAVAVLNACTMLAKPSLQPLRIGISTWPGFDIVLYAQAANLFKERGLEVELIRFENQQDSSRAVLRGALDAAFASLWDIVQSDPGNDSPAVVMVTNISNGADGVVARSGIQSIEELRGKRVGAKLGTVNHLILLEALQLHGIEPNAVMIEDVSNETAVEMLQKGKLDGAVLWQPLLGETAEKINGNIVYTTKEINSLVIDTLMSRLDTVNAKKAELTRFVSTWLDVMYAIDTKPTEVYEVVGQQLGQSGEAFAADFNGLQKGDIAMQEKMFRSPDGLKAAITQISQLLRTDPRAGRLPREDVDINPELVTAAIEGWKP